MGINRANRPIHITILGGGVGGLAVGYAAKRKGLPFTVFEASNQIGGNCITFRYGDFLFDSGAHRFHDKDTEVTTEVKNLLGEHLKRINVPSRIYHNGKSIDFPLSPLNLMTNLGLYTFAKAVVEVLRSRLSTGRPDGTFESNALRTYGNTIAKLFLLNYSEKLWGVSCNKLCSIIAGYRMKGLNLKTFLVEAILGQESKTRHLEGSFYYPKMGIGAIAKKLQECCGENSIRRNSKITKIMHNHKRILAIEINGEESIYTDEVLSTLPLDVFLQIMEPKPPKETLLFAKRLRYRDLILVAFFLNRKSVTETASVYFPEPCFPFTRIYEPKNRSTYMSPPEQTSLIAEIPCQQNDEFWSLEDDKLIQLIRSRLVQIGWMKEEEIIGASVRRISYAYPILEIGYEEKLQKVNAFLKRFSNLKLSGRNGKFTYSWIHNMMQYAKEIIEQYVLSIKATKS